MAKIILTLEDNGENVVFSMECEPEIIKEQCTYAQCIAVTIAAMIKAEAQDDVAAFLCARIEPIVATLAKGKGKG